MVRVACEPRMIFEAPAVAIGEGQVQWGGFRCDDHGPSVSFRVAFPVTERVIQFSSVLTHDPAELRRLQVAIASAVEWLEAQK